MFAKAHHPLPRIQDAHGYQYCPDGVSYAKSHHMWHSGVTGAHEGDVIFYDWNGDGVSDHTGIVTRNNGDGSVNTIEGNSGPGSTEVVTHRRSGGTIMGYLRV